MLMQLSSVKWVWHFMADSQQIQFTLENLLVVNLIMKERISRVCQKNPTLLPWGRQKTLIIPTRMDAMLLVFPEMNNYSYVSCKESRWGSSLLWVGRCITVKFCSSASLQRQYCDFCLECIF